MGQIRLYAILAMKDVFRLWGATQLQVIIISGICLPILILLGLKNGHVAELREELVTSPVGRQVIFWSSQKGELLSESTIADIQNSLPSAQLIIPESQRVVFLKSTGGAAAQTAPPGESAEPVPITLYSTKPGDPILGQFGADVLAGKELECVLAQSLADTHELKVGEMVTLEILRQLGGERQAHQLQFRLKGLLPSGKVGDQAAIGYADLSVMQELERYGTGAAIEAWNIPAMEGLAAVDLYESMLLFCFKGRDTELSENDFEFMKSRGLEATEVADPNLITLFGALKETAIEDLKVYRLQRIDRRDGRIEGIRDTPQLLVRNTDAEDDFIVRWSDPLEIEINGVAHRHIGLTLPTRRQTGGWIQTYLREQAVWFTYQETVDRPLSVRGPEGPLLEKAAQLSLQLSAETRAELADLSDLRPGQSPAAEDAAPDSAAPPDSDAPAAEDNADQATRQEASVEADDSEPPPSQAASDAGTDPAAQAAAAAAAADPPAEGAAADGTVTQLPLAVVPVNLLALVHQYREGLVQFDADGQRFTDIPAELDYTKARLYTRTIDDVPAAVDFLAGRNFAVLSEGSRIAEIQEQDSSLQMLVAVVAIGVFVFGVVTVFSVLVDSTDRKKGTIGILRVMGMTRFGVFFMVLFRALVIGLLAAVLCSCVGYGLAALLGADFSGSGSLVWKPTISVILNPQDVGLVALGAVLCASFGAVMPSLKASSLDPFEAIMEGQFH